ncbi:MAG: tRNA 2-thiouridine(34) synthase MnmA [bacterium]
MRVVVAMSGGIDSSVAAALLKARGYEVIGVTMNLFDHPTCCGGSVDAQMAKRAAAALGIPFYIINLTREFEKLVIEHFCREYSQGRTPNPCIRCNELIKFQILRQKSDQFDAEFIATGHYARIKRDGHGVYHLLKAVDRDKDQSYFLYTLNQTQLAHLLLPIGEYYKKEVRQMAKDLGLPNAEKDESQDICFVRDDDYAAFLRERLPGIFKPGPIKDSSGRFLGRHYGIANFTIGQRKGLKIALGERHYVVRIDVPDNTVIIGGEAEVRMRQVWAEDCRWVLGQPPAEKFRVRAKVRYQGPSADAEVESLPEERIYVTFQQPQWAPTPGQAIVLWNGDEVLGGATIEESKP